jgi:hypothetical protein
LIKINTFVPQYQNIVLYCMYEYEDVLKKYKLNMITPIKYSLLVTAFLVITLMTSCSDQGMMSSSLVDTISTKDIMEKSVNRTVKSMAEEEEENKVSISVIYTGDLDEILLDESTVLYKVIHRYHLNLESPFEIDENMKGIVLSSHVKMEDPVSIGKQISKGKTVLMVEIKNLPDADV